MNEQAALCPEPGARRRSNHHHRYRDRYRTGTVTGTGPTGTGSTEDFTAFTTRESSDSDER